MTVMMVKAVDMAWIGDRSLDIYCSRLADGDAAEHREFVSSSVMDIFDSVFDSMTKLFRRRYDKLFVMIPCFPLMRMNKTSTFTRFGCNNRDFLSKIGVSPSQFMDFFEKFIVKKCRNEYVTDDGCGCFLLNGRAVLLHDWKDALTRRYGSSLVDFAKSEPFDANPCFLHTMEDDMGAFTETGEDMCFRLDRIIENLT